jgi:hypothetical protein
MRLPVEIVRQSLCLRPLCHRSRGSVCRWIRLHRGAFGHCIHFIVFDFIDSAKRTPVSKECRELHSASPRGEARANGLGAHSCPTKLPRQKTFLFINTAPFELTPQAGSHCCVMDRLGHGSDVPVLENLAFAFTSSPDGYVHHDPGQVVAPNHLAGK